MLQINSTHIFNVAKLLFQNCVNFEIYKQERGDLKISEIFKSPNEVRR